MLGVGTVPVNVAVKGLAQISGTPLLSQPQPQLPVRDGKHPHDRLVVLLDAEVCIQDSFEVHAPATERLAVVGGMPQPSLDDLGVHAWRPARCCDGRRRPRDS
jgi:hypothetical protein